MPRRRPPPPRRPREEWARLVAEHARSGLSRAAFARDRGLSARALQWWAWRLREAAPEPSRAVELVVRQSTPVVRVEIVLGDLLVRVHDAAPTEVAALVRELRATC